MSDVVMGKALPAVGAEAEVAKQKVLAGIRAMSIADLERMREYMVALLPGLSPELAFGCRNLIACASEELALRGAS